jgi:uncharacterized protein GlcG (DUF336 family)
MSTAAVIPLSTSEADSLISAANRAAQSAGVAVSVAVLDTGGHLLAFRRDDRAPLVSGETSRAKAYTSLQLNTATTDLAAAAQPGAPLHSLHTALDRPVLFLGGGVPIHRDGRLIGAIGVGGGTPDQDHSFATTAIETLG